MGKKQFRTVSIKNAIITHPIAGIRRINLDVDFVPETEEGLVKECCRICNGIFGGRKSVVTFDANTDISVTTYEIEISNIPKDTLTIKEEHTLFGYDSTSKLNEEVSRWAAKLHSFRHNTEILSVMLSMIPDEMVRENVKKVLASKETE